MRAVAETKRLRRSITLCLALVALAAAGQPPAAAQSLDMGGSAETTVPKAGGLDMDVSPTAPLSTAPGSSNANVTTPDTLRAGLTLLRPFNATKQPSDAPAPGSSDTTGTLSPQGDGSQDKVSGAQPDQLPTEPVTLDHPNVVDTAKLSSGDKSVALFGIVGLPGEPATGLQGFIAQAGPQVTCQQHTGAEFVCFLADGTDVALVSLVNGAAQARADAPDAYREQEAAAQSARRGIWSNLPPPPVEVKHPAVRDTGTLVVDSKVYMLDGVDGLGGPYARDLQGYVAANGDSLLCQPQGKPDHYICVLPDGTDVAKVALVNGAAKVVSDSPDSYRVQQGEALANNRGIWKDCGPSCRQRSVPVGPSQYTIVPADESDGVSYVGGVPAAVINGQTVFLSYGGAGGWGYWDHSHHWQGAPDRYRSHLEQFHPGGSGIRGFGGFGGSTRLASSGMGGHFGGASFVRPTAMGGGGFHMSGGGGGVHAAGGGGGHHR